MSLLTCCVAGSRLAQESGKASGARLRGLRGLASLAEEAGRAQARNPLSGWFVLERGRHRLLSGAVALGAC